VLKSAPSPPGALREHLRFVSDEVCVPQGDCGCSAVKIALKLANWDGEVWAIVDVAFSSHERNYAHLLGAAVEKGELPGAFDVERTARLRLRSLSLSLLVMGMRVLSRSSMPRSAIESARDQALSVIEPIPGGARN